MPVQRRLTAGRRLPEIVRQHPGHFVAFDLLRDGRGVELLDQPLTVRRAKLARQYLGLSAHAELSAYDPAEWRLLVSGQQP